MKQLIIILLCLVTCTAFGQTIGYFRYDTSKFYTTKVGGRGSIDVTGAVKFTGLLPKSAGTDSVVVRDANGYLGTTAKGAFGGSVTASNGLTVSSGDVKLGGTLTDTTTITQVAFPIYYTLDGNSDGEFTRYTNLIGNGSYVNFFNLNDGTIDLRFYNNDTIESFIDNGGAAAFKEVSTRTLTIRRDGISNPTPQISINAPASLAGSWGLVLPTTDGAANEFLQTDGNGVTTWAAASTSGANTALSNLASVAINTSLLPGTDNAIDLGSIAKRYRSLYSMGGVFSDTLRVEGETHLMGKLGVGTDVPGYLLDLQGSANDYLLFNTGSFFVGKISAGSDPTNMHSQFSIGEDDANASFTFGATVDNFSTKAQISGSGNGANIIYAANNGHEFGGNVGIGAAADATGNLLVNDLASSQISLVTASTTGVLGKSVGYNSLIPPVMNFRLTTASDTPVTNGDRIAQSTIYMTPYNGNHISLYSGSAWVDHTTAQISLALSGLTSGKNYDVFAYNNAGTITLELSAAWTNDNTRADAVVRQDGVLVKSGATTRRYIGTIRTTSTTTTEDSEGGTTTQVGGKRFVWNLYNQVMRTAKVIDKTDSWSYTTATWRQENGNAGNQVEYVTGDASSLVDAMYNAMVLVTNTAVNSGIGISSTTTPSGFSAGTYNSGTFAAFQAVKYVGTPGLGYFYVAPLEKGQGSGTSSWFGDNGTTDTQSGLSIIITN